MLERIEVKNNYCRYKSPGEMIPDGLYYRTNARLNLNEKLKKGLRAVPAQNEQGRFCWLLNYEPWVKRLIEGYEPPEYRLYDQVDLEDPDTEQVVKDEFFLPSGIWETLRVWQRQKLADVAVCLQKAGFYRRGIVAPIGSGKTLFGLCVAAGAKRPCVLAPSHLHSTWADEARKFGLGCPYISTYESAHHVCEAPDCVIMDEVLAVKNEATIRHQKALKLCKDAKVVIGYTGTPSSVNPMDLRWLRVSCPGCVPAEETAWRFLWGKDTELVEVAPEKKVYVTKTWDKDGLAEFTKPYLGIISAKEIASELPAVTYQRIYLPRPRRFDMVLRGAATEGGASKRIAQARQMTDGFFYDDLDQPMDIDTVKLDALEELVNGTEEPVVIFAAWSHTVACAAERFKSHDPAVLSGDRGNYGDQILRFREGKTRLLIANGRISTGMNLQRSRIEVFMSNHANPTDRVQAEGRVVRPGGEHEGVVIYDLICKDTLDEKTLDTLKSHSSESEGFVLSALEKEFKRLCKTSN